MTWSAGKGLLFCNELQSIRFLNRSLLMALRAGDTFRIGRALGYFAMVVASTYSGGRGESTWFFSTEDYLPRRRIRHFTTPDGDGSLDMTVTGLEIDPEVTADTFALRLPEGYQQVDDFAP